MGFLGVLRREHSFAAEGIVPVPEERSLPLPAIGLFILAAGAAGIALSSDTSLFSPALIAAFFSWIARLLASLFKPSERLPPPPPEFEAMMAPSAPGIPQVLLEMTEQTEPWPYWDYVKYFAIGIAVILFLWFMIYPLLSRPRLALGGVSLLEYIRRFLVRWFSAIGRGFASFFASLRQGGGHLKIAKPSAAEINRLAGDLLAGYSAAKRKEMRRSVTLFARLIHWGAEYCKIVWKPSYAPGEFCALLAAAADALCAETAQTETAQTETAPDEKTTPAIGPAIIRCGELFEKAIYSAQPLTDDEGKEFKNLVEEITDK
jgi:hypothetical protein